MFPYLSEKQKLVLHTVIWLVALYLVFRYLIPLILPFLVAILLSKLIRPMVRFLHKMFRIPMGWGAGVVLTGSLVVLLVIGCFLGKMAMEQLVRLGQKLPEIWNQCCEWLWACGKQAEMYLGLPVGTMTKQLGRITEEDLFVRMESVLTDHASAVVGSSIQGALIAGKAALSFLVTFFITIGATVMTTIQLEEIRCVLDRSVFRREIQQMIRTITRVGTAYGKTQLVIMLCTVIISAVGLTILGDPYALLWSAAIGLVDALPIFGAGTILWPWILLSVLRGQWKRAVGLAIIYGVANLARQWLEARYMGDRIGISALENLIAMYLGLKLFGILGLFWGPIGYLLIRERGERMGVEKETMDRG